MQFLSLAGQDDRSTGSSSQAPEEAVLVSPSVERAGMNLPSQFALLGQLRTRQMVADPRVMLNTNIPFSAFICGLQGSGKSHTTSCMIGELTCPVRAFVEC